MKRPVMIFILGMFLQIVLLQSVLATTDSANITMHIVEPSREYYQSSIPVVIHLNEKVDELILVYRSEARVYSKVLCEDCKIYDNVTDLKEGYNFVKIQAWRNGILIKEKEMKIIIDSRLPKIVKILPKRGFSDGLFEIEFKEEFTDKIELNYGTDSNMKKAFVDYEDDCYDGQRGTNCKINVNLSEFDSQHIGYYFKIIDKAGNKMLTKNYELEVDIKKPVIKSFEFNSEKKKVTFSFEIYEKNFEEIVMVDSEGDRRPKSLCRKLNPFNCIKTVNFREGEHNLTIYVYDEAGNYNFINNINFYCSNEGCEKS